MEKNKKLLKWLKFLVIVCIAIIVVEGIYIGVKMKNFINVVKMIGLKRF